MIRQIIFALSLVAFATASELSDFSLPYSPPKLETLDGYPGVLSREYVQQAVEQELRYQIAELYQQGQNNTKAAEQQPRILKYSGSGDISGLNDLLKTFEIEIPRNNFSADVLGTTATVFVEGRCGDIFIDSIGLDYETGGDSLTYHINVQDLDLKCQINVDWNLGALDVEDKLSIRVVFNNNDFMIGVTLTGAPPTSSSFEGCNAVINVASISSTGGFSSNIINELSDLILQVVRQEAQTISDILCDLLGDFTGTVDELLLTLEETLAPYLTKVAKVDPLRLEKEVQVDKKLVDLQDSTLGEVLQVFITNLRGVIGAFQINTLIELNLLDENGQYVLDLTNRRRLQEDGTEECSLLRRRRNLLTASDEDVASTFNANAVQNLRGIINEELAMPLGEQVKESLRRQLQEAEEPGIFAVNEFELQSVVLEGLNSFKDSQLLEIIGRQTLRSRLSVDGLKVVVTLLLDYDLVQSRVVDTITATLSVDGISVTASFFAGLDDEAISGLTLGNFLNTTSLPDCLLSTVVAAGVSELAVSVKSVGSPIVSGVLSPGIDQLLNTAVKAAFVTYEDLIHQAVPNFFQNNVTVILNDFLDCYIRVNAEPKSCPDITTAEALNGEGGLLGGGGGDSGSSTSGVEGDSGVTFQFKNEGGSTTQFNGVSNGDSSSTSQNSTQGSTSTTSTNTSDGTSSTATSGSSTTQSTGSTEKSGSFIGTGASSFQNAAASVAADGYVNGFIDFRDLFLPPDLARSLGGRGTQPYGNLIPMGYEMMKDKMVSLDNVTGLPTFNSEVLQPLTEGQSGVNGMFRFPETFFNYSLDTLAVELLQSVLKRIDIDASYVRLGNLNTLVSPVKFLEPTKNPHVLENILNFGPVTSRPVNMSFNLRTNLQGIGSPAVWSNKIDISATASEVDILTDFRLMVATNEFLQFPIKDILNFNCWLALIQAPNMDVNKEGTIDNALAVKSFLMNVISTTLELKCVDCMSVLLPGALKILEQTGATRTLGKRLGGLLEEVVTVDTVPAFLTDFLKLGEEAARLCPHRPTFNTTSDENRTLALDIPPLSNQAIDTIMLAGVLGAEVMAVSFSESHVRDGVETRDPLYRQSSTLAEQSDLLDWTRLNETFVPFAGDLLDFARGYLGGSRDESGVLGVNVILGDFLDEDGGIELDLHGVSFDFSGLQINVHAAKVKGLDSFMAFDTLRPIAPQTLQNDVELNKLSIQADFSVNATGAADPRPYRVSFDLEDVNATVFVFAALDERKLGSLEMGSLLKVQNIVPCFMSTAREVYITAMNMSIGNITKPTIEGFLQDSNEAISASMEAMFQSYGPEVADTISSLLDSTLRGLVNDILASYTENMSACKNTLADLSGGSATLKFGGGAADLQPPQTLEDFLDFRDLLLPPTSAMDFGGSGTQPYGDLASMVYSMVKDQLSSSSEGAFLETNALLVEPFTESQSGVKGMLQFKQELFNFVSEKIPVSLLDWLEESMKLSAFDARFQNLNTLVSPISVFQPTHRAHVLENMLNFGRVPERSLNATVGLLVAIDGDLSALNMYNEFDLSASLAEVDLVTDISLTVAKDKLFRFPLKDIMEVNCWLSMIQAPPKTEGETSSSYGFEMKSFLMKLASLSVDLKCRNCTSTILPQLTSVLDETGVSETLGNRLGPLLEEISTSEVVPSMLDKLFRFGDKAARFCPHSPLFNTTEISTAKITPNMTLPKLSAASLDTVLFGAVVAGQVASVMIADGHVQDYSDPINPFPGQSDPAIPEGSQLLDWMNLNNSNIPFIGDTLHLIQSSFGEQTVSESGATDLGANVFFRNLLGGSIKVPLWSGLGLNASGVRFSIKSVNLEGLDSFSRFDVLQPRSEHKLENIISAKSIKVGLDLTAEALETSDPPREVSILFPIEELNITMPMTAVIDEGRLGALTMGALLNSSNIVPCLLSTTYGLRLEQMVVSVKDVAEPIVEGFLPDTEEAISNSSRAILLEFGSTIGEALPRIFDHTVRTLINGIIADQEEKECLKPSTIPASRYVDFREMFGASDMPEMPYGDLMPIVKGVIESGLLSINPETQVPMINDAVIAPMTEQQSGTRGTLARIGQFYGLDYDGLTEIGINNVSIGFFDARIENLNTIGPPLKILEPNSTSGVLLDNAATFGTELHPLRFAIRNTLALSGPLLQTQDELEIFGELHGAPFLAVLLARIGTEEFLSFPLQHAANMHCWLATIAAPALEEMAQGKTKVDPVLALLYLGIEFSSVQLSASCFNCTTPGLVRLPELLDIMEESGTKNVLGNRVLNMVAEAITSDFAQVWILKILQDSVRKCPLTQDSTGSSLVIADADMPQFSADTMETGIFAAAVFAQFTTVVLAETISIVDKELGPMFEEPEPDIPPGTRLVDFTALDTYPVGSLAKTVIQGANSFLGEESTDPETGETTLGINELLGENPLWSLDTFSQEFQDFGMELSGLNIQLKEIKVSGLDSFDKFHIFDIVGPTQLHNELSWKNLQVELFLEIDASASPAKDDKISLSIEIGASDISTSLELMLALDYELLKTLQLGSLLRFEHILPCIQATVRHLEISKMKLDVGRITKMKLKGLESTDTSEAAQSLEMLLLQKYGDVLADAAPSLFSVVLRPLINTAITSYIRDSDFKCDEFPFDSDDAGFVDFRDLFLSTTQAKRYGGSGLSPYGDLMRAVFGIMRLQLISAHPEEGIELLTPLVGSLSFPGVLLNQGMKLDVKDLQADVSLQVSDLQVNNLESLGRPLSFLDPVKDEAHQLNNSATLGIGNKPVEIGVRVYMHVKGLGGLDLVNDFDLTLDVHSATVVLTVLLRVSEEAFVRFPLRDILDVNCWLATIPPPPLDRHGVRIEGSEPSAALTDVDINAKKLNLRLNCHNCSSPALLDLSESLAAPKSAEEITDVVNRLLGSITSSFKGGYIQDRINRILVEAPKRCGHTDAYDINPTPATYEFFEYRKDQSSSSFTTLLVVILIPICFALASALGVRQVVLKRHQNWLVALPSERVFLIQQIQEKEEQKDAELDELTQSMFRSQDIPLFVRQLIPIVVLINIGFFLSGHLNKGGRVMIDFVFAGETFQLDNFYTFSIGQSTVDMWHNGGKELAMLILLFSGVWPYTKQLITLALWFLPPSVVSCSRRGQFLVWLDILAKWSMVDIIVMLITVVGFRVQIRSPDFAFVPKDFYSVDLVVVPMWGLYANMIAQLISQVSSHFIVHYHRRIIRRASATYEKQHGIESERNLTTEFAGTGGLLPSPDQEEKKDQLCQYSFSRPHREESDRLIVRRYVNRVLLSGSILLSILLIGSCGISSVKLETFGVVGLLIEFGQNLNEAVRYEGVYSMANMLNEQARYLGGFTHHIGLGFLSFLFVMTVMVVPVVQMSTLMFQWFFPLADKGRERVAIILEMLQAWQYLEVFVLAILVESWQLGSISRLLLNHLCTGLDFTFNLLVYYGVLDDNDGQCFAIEASVGAGTYLMVPIIIGISLVNSFVVKGYTQYLREKREASETISEDEKLRAFDRTHWDSREETLESIQTPSVQFTDTFRWTLCREDGGIGKSEQEEEESKPFGGASTFSMIETSSSDEEHGEKPSITNTESSNTSNSENIDFAVPSGDHSATTAGSQTNPDVASSTTTESQQDSTEDKSYDT